MTRTIIPDRDDLGYDCEQHALSYARAGVPVLPLHNLVNEAHDLKGRECSCARPTCESIAKHPRPKDWVREATTREDTIRRWWRTWPHAGVGILTGERSGFVVVDIDPKHDGFGTFAKLEAAHPFRPSLLTLEAGTGGNGAHLFYQHPGFTFGNKADVFKHTFGHGIDIRGDGGMVVAAPSLHASGRRYAWCDGPEAITEIQPMPTWFMELILAPAPSKPATMRPTTDLREYAADRGGRNGRNLEAAMRGVIERLEGEGAGNRNALLYWAANRALDLIEEGAPPQFIADVALAAERTDPPLTPDEIRQTIQSAIRRRGVGA